MFPSGSRLVGSRMVPAWVVQLINYWTSSSTLKDENIHEIQVSNLAQTAQIHRIKY